MRRLSLGGCGILAGWLLLSALASVSWAEEREWILLSGAADRGAWRGTTDGWVDAGGVTLDPQNPRRLASQPGTGVLVNGPSGRARNLLSKQDFGDLEAHVEFLIPKGSNSGVKCVGLYEVQILDSHGVKTPTANDCGGIYPRAEDKPKYHYLDKGTPPRTNAARPAGEWQTLDVVFQATRFDANGKKIANARFVKVVLNGTVIHENLEVATPTGAAWRNPESAKGPLLLQGDHGPVAFREVRVRPYNGEVKKD